MSKTIDQVDLVEHLIQRMKASKADGDNVEVSSSLSDPQEVDIDENLVNEVKKLALDLKEGLNLLKADKEQFAEEKK